ncbi:hypothetical protein K492DRAFT_196896 [Lichtheimia hyalospora FSU 10163]|nr:hypothetical protein K492DRAFT_196896 [Lichtheimia hyalospora FSU 10163]
MLQFLGDRNNVDTTVIDFCATFFDSLAEHGKLETKKPFNRSRVKYNRLNGNIKNSEAFNANASKWLRFIPEIKQSIIMGLLHVRILQLRFPVNEDLGVVPDNHVCFTEAPFDAESMVLALAYILEGFNPLVPLEFSYAHKPSRCRSWSMVDVAVQ